MPDQRVGVALRRVVQARARDLCEYCRCPAQFATQSFTVEHVEPRDIGGETALHRWSDHFAWSADFTRIEGKTPLGRATIDVLHCNRTGVVNLRRVLVAAGLHPPSET